MTLQEALEFTGLNKRQLCVKLGIKAQNATWWNLRGRVPEKHIAGILALKRTPPPAPPAGTLPG